jgi:polysaccharide deacetylase 2 family uncharacterized protein YibQ
MSGFAAGFLKGAIASVVVGVGVSLMAPLPPVDPADETAVEVPTPEGSGFNAARTDTNPVLPNTDQRVTPEPAPAPEVATAPASQPTPDTETASRPEATGSVDAPAVAPGEDEVAIVTPSVEDTEPARPPALGVPMPEIDNPVTEIPVHRLPQVEEPVTEVETPSAPSEDAAPTTPEPVTSPPAASPDGALMTNRVAFDNPEGRPLLSIVLIYAGDEGLDQDMLMTFSFPVTFAVPADLPDATAVAKRLAGAGFEVIAMAPATVADWTKANAPAGVAETYARIPEAVAFVDAPKAALQKDMDTAGSVIAALKAPGLGYLSYDQGLNTADKTAQRLGVQSGLIFNVLDGERENGVVIKRYLDRAAFEAGKTGQTIVIGHTYPETVTALFSWGMSGRPQTIALAPVSAALLGR